MFSFKLHCAEGANGIFPQNSQVETEALINFSASLF